MEEEQMIKILKTLRNEINLACMCKYIEFPEKQQWREQVIALDWILGEKQKWNLKKSQKKHTKKKN